MQFGQPRGVQAGPDARLGPVPQPAQRRGVERWLGDVPGAGGVGVEGGEGGQAPGGVVQGHARCQRAVGGTALVRRPQGGAYAQVLAVDSVAFQAPMPVVSSVKYSRSRTSVSYRVGVVPCRARPCLPRPAASHWARTSYGLGVVARKLYVRGGKGRTAL